MINTSSHDEFKNTIYNVYDISDSHEKDASYNGKRYPALEPKLSFWTVWHYNIGRISEEKNNKYYVEQYWKQVLSKLDIEEVYKELNYSTLLCYEPNDQFCHRHIVAAWFELLLGTTVPEINYKFEKVEKPEYIKEYLEEVIRKNKDMKGFTSLRALYLYEKSEKLEGEAASFTRSEADIEEQKYRELKKNKKKTKIKKYLGI